MEHVFISFVGLQPSAVAVSLASWIQARSKPDKVIFFITDRVREIANRLTGWIDEVYQIKCESILISRDPVPTDGQLSLSETIQQVLNEHKFYQIVFNAEPGLNTHVAILSEALPENSISLHGMVDKTHVCLVIDNSEHWEEIENVNIGLDSLLSLYNIQYEITGCSHKTIHEILKGKIPKKVIQGLNIKGTQIQFDLAFEKSGFLYVLKFIEGNDPQQIRDLQRVHNDLHGLQPRIAILSSDKSSLTRARTVGFIPINSNTSQGISRFTRWIDRQVPLPGSESYSEPTAMNKVFETGLTLDQHIKGKGGTGNNLTVCLGNDPSATLMSLCTHKPKQAIIFYDTNTKVIAEMAHRLSKEIHNISVGEAKFLKTDIIGKNIGDFKLKDIATPLIIDITPGTKAQACALACLSRINNSEIWSLRGDTGESVCISEPNKKKNLCVPNILTQAKCCGGDITNFGINQNHLKYQKHFWVLLTQFFDRYVKEGGKDFRLTNLKCTNGYLKPIGKFFEVKLDNQIEKLEIRLSEGGFWFESMVAGCFLFAGANEIMCNIKWDWPGGIAYTAYKGKTFMNEVDVICRINHRFIAISCKLGQNQIAKPKREIEAVARAGLGRFCIPIFIRPKISDDMIEESINSNRGAVLLDIEYIAYPDRLKDTLIKAFKSRTTSER